MCCTYILYTQKQSKKGKGEQDDLHFGTLQYSRFINLGSHKCCTYIAYTEAVQTKARLSVRTRLSAFQKFETF